MKSFILGLILTVGTPLTLQGADVSDNQFQLQVLNEALIIKTMKNDHQYFQQGALIDIENKTSSQVDTTRVACRFDWAADGDEEVQIPRVLTAVLKVENVGQSSTVKVSQVGFGFKEAPVVLSCNRMSETPIKFEDIEASLKGIVALLPPPPEVQSGSRLASTAMYERHGP